MRHRDPEETLKSLVEPAIRARNTISLWLDMNRLFLCQGRFARLRAIVRSEQGDEVQMTGQEISSSALLGGRTNPGGLRKHCEVDHHGGECHIHDTCTKTISFADRGSFARPTLARARTSVLKTSMRHTPTLTPANVSDRQSGDLLQYVRDEPLPPWQLPLASDLS
jgi:hypothetical protein